MSSTFPQTHPGADTDAGPWGREERDHSALPEVQTSLPCMLFWRSAGGAGKADAGKDKTYLPSESECRPSPTVAMFLEFAWGLLVAPHLLPHWSPVHSGLHSLTREYLLVQKIKTAGHKILFTCIFADFPSLLPSWKGAPSSCLHPSELRALTSHHLRGFDWLCFPHLCVHPPSLLPHSQQHLKAADVSHTWYTLPISTPYSLPLHTQTSERAAYTPLSLSTQTHIHVCVHMSKKFRMVQMNPTKRDCLSQHRLLATQVPS